MNTAREPSPGMLLLVITRPCQLPSTPTVSEYRFRRARWMRPPITPSTIPTPPIRANTKSRSDSVFQNAGDHRDPRRDEVDEGPGEREHDPDQHQEDFRSCVRPRRRARPPPPSRRARPLPTSSSCDPLRAGRSRSSPRPIRGRCRPARALIAWMRFPACTASRTSGGGASIETSRAGIASPIFEYSPSTRRVSRATSAVSAAAISSVGRHHTS